MRTATRKVPGGKLIRLRAELDGTLLRGAQLSGDFFVMPASGLADIEDALEGFDLRDLAALPETIQAIMTAEDIAIAGFSPEDIAALAEELARG